MDSQRISSQHIRLYNTMTRCEEDFTPQCDNKVGVYSCGPTVYFYAHLGNMRTYIFADTLVRTLILAGLSVTHVMNITDVGHLVSDADEGADKMAVGAAREGLTAWEIAEKYTNAFFQQSAMLNIRRPDIVCRATDHIRQQIEMAAELERRGLTYITSDGLYFDTEKFPDYGNLARLDIDGLQAGARVDLRDKRNKTDFALWKFAKAGEARQMEWDSPWGMGFPGWHLECSAMATHYLGPSIDIHTGGIDHIPIHHTNEIAQSECSTGVHPFVRVWMHSNFLQFTGDERMAKSKGNIITVEKLAEAGYQPLSFRYLCLKAHYRSDLKFSLDILDGAAAGYRRLREQVAALEIAAGYPDPTGSDEYKSRIAGALFDDLSTPTALVWLQRALDDHALPAAAKLHIVATFDTVFALDLLKPMESVTLPPEVAALIEARDVARASRNWSEADILRDRIEALGYEVRDTHQGTQVARH